MSELKLEDRAPRPRIEIEEAASPRLEALPAVIPPAAAERGIDTPRLILGGASVLILGLAALQTGNFVAAQFDRAAFLGWLSLAVAVAGFGLIGAGFWRETRALARLHSVDLLRADLSSGELDRTRTAARAWLARLPDATASSGAIDAADSPAAILALLRAGPGTTLRAQADALGRVAAVQIFAATAAIPSPALDGILVAWRGLRLVRQIAELHGLRPGLFGTWALVRRTLLSAASVTATDLAADTVTRALLSNPLLAHVAGDVAGAGVAARRVLVLSRAIAVACTPVPEG